MKLILVLFALFLIAGIAYVRLAPLPTARFSAKPGPHDPGTHKTLGGVKVVLPLAGLPEHALARLAQIASDTPRTVKIVSVQKGEQPLCFVTRSRVWGFPDIAILWEEGGNLHIHSHLVFGKGDMGVNGAKVAAWVKALNAAPAS